MDQENTIKPKQKIDKTIVISMIIVLFISILLWLISAPSKFEMGKIIVVEKGQSIKQIATVLKENKIIRSRTIFNIIIQSSERQIVASGEYAFDSRINVFEVARRLRTSDYGLPITKITLTEGMTNIEMSELLAKNYKNFSSVEFLEKTEKLEGYLFPDTYKFHSIVLTEEIVETLQNNFQDKIDSINEIIESSNYSLEQIIIMASIVEKESTKNSRQEVANILWKRYEMNMALQVDAPFVYAIGKGTADLTTDDLREDSPFNTYTRTGLIPSPISNPGLESILAAAQPQKTDNLYFLTGKDGQMHYAKSFEGHKKNRALYLD